MSELQVIQDFKAAVSPCYTCDVHGLGMFPECVSECRRVNNYLISIGDIPHVPRSKYLYLIFPPEKKSGTQIVCCTPEQYDELSLVLNRKKKETGKTAQTISYESGVGVSSIRSVLRHGQSRINENSYQRLWEWVER